MMSSEHQLYKEAIEGLLPNRDKIQKKVLGQGPVSRLNTKRRKWLIPVAASLLALILVCATVPSVRAAISQWFSRNYSVQNYLAQPEEARPSTPELDTIIEQTMPEETQLKNSIEIATIAPEWKEWADNLNPSVGDIFFDGKRLMVSFDMGGGAGEFVIGGNIMDDQYPIGITFSNPGYMILNGEKYAYSMYAGVSDSEYIDYLNHVDEDGHLSDDISVLVDADESVPFTATIDLSRKIESRPVTVDSFPEGYEDDYKVYMEYVDRLQQYDSDFTPGEYKTAADKLTGIQHAEIHLPLIATDFSTPSKVDDDGNSYQGMCIGMMKICFSFEPEAGYNTLQSYEINRTIKLKGEGTYAWADWDSDPDYVTFVNKTIDMSGVTVKAKRIDCYASGAELYMSITCPDEWDEKDKQCFLGNLTPNVTGEGIDLRTSGERHGFEEEGEDLGMCIGLNMLPSEIEAINTYGITLTLGRFSGYDDVPYVEGEPTRIKKEDVKGWQEDSQTLDDCVLRFSLNK